MFAEQVGWAVEAGVDFVIAETYSWLEEALIALETIKEAGLPAVVTFTVNRTGHLRSGESPEEACQQAEAGGADVVGLNCARGPASMLPIIERIRGVVGCQVAALPVPYRTSQEHPTMQSLADPTRPERPFPTALDPFTCTRYEIGDFARAAKELGVAYLGVCCGAGPHHVRALAEALGRTPPASRYAADMSLHSYLGSDPAISEANRDYARDL